jgi:hypothetical protein
MHEPATVFDRLNAEIASFVNGPGNLRLKPGTGHYSPLFRGRLFGKELSSDVEAELNERSAAVLWLGTNPNMPQSLGHIMQHDAGPGDYPLFERHCLSGLYSSSRWNEAGPTPDWNPIQNPTGGWRVYRDALAQVYPVDAVAMANFLPWGSATAEELVGQIGLIDRALLGRLLEFADHLNVQAVSVLRPKLIVVPFSLGRSRAMDKVRRSGLAMADTWCTSHTVPGLKQAFTFFTGECRRGPMTVRTLHLRHPSSLHFSRDDRARILDSLVAVLADAV